MYDPLLRILMIDNLLYGNLVIVHSLWRVVLNMINFAQPTIGLKGREIMQNLYNSIDSFVCQPVLLPDL